ncbi:hypothetical protein C9374_000834 [Naegleria lovaniensis]|uniref:Uncharacterized protein n=1 Tax=Naegleria lovaniensis TaxID=51637 RepID=A0AA88KNF6_NAELO|nr:uncharacterized protein C9374_000834 [Naegleria lovaniensis]KAG2387984.1 hypothetical protein C9374_000834 [Naegleria lovaniensis]
MSSFNTTTPKTNYPGAVTPNSKQHDLVRLSYSAQTLSSPHTINLSHSFNDIYNNKLASQQIPAEHNESEPLQQHPSFIRTPKIINNSNVGSNHEINLNNNYLFNIPQYPFNNHCSPNTQFLTSRGFLHDEDEDELPKNYSWTKNCVSPSDSRSRASKENISKPLEFSSREAIVEPYQGLTSSSLSAPQQPPPPYSELPDYSFHYTYIQPNSITKSSEMQINCRALRQSNLDQGSSRLLSNNSPRNEGITFEYVPLNGVDVEQDHSFSTPKQQIAFHEEFVQNSQDNQIPKLAKEKNLDPPPPYEEIHQPFTQASIHVFDPITKSRNVSSPNTPSSKLEHSQTPSIMNSIQSTTDFEKTDQPRMPVIVDPVQANVQSPGELQQHNDFKAIDISNPLKSEPQIASFVENVAELSVEQQIEYHTQKLRELQQVAKKTTLTERNRILHLTHYLLSLFEILITITIINFAVASFWRGTWVLIETYVVFNETSPISSTQISWFYLACGIAISFFVHISGLITKQSNLTHKLEEVWLRCIGKNQDSKKSSTCSKFMNLLLLGLLWIMEKVFVYVAGLGCVFSWVGVFNIWDKYVSPFVDISSRAPSGWIAHGTGLGMLLLLTSLRSILTAPVLSQMDRNMSFVGFLSSRWDLITANLFPDKSHKKRVAV